MKAGIKIGYATAREVRPGIWEDDIFEMSKLADIVTRTEPFVVEGTIIPEYRTTTTVSVLSDGLLVPDNSDMRYVAYAGRVWSVSSVTHAPPRIQIYIGEVYNGPVAGGTPGDSGGDPVLD